MSGPAKFEMHRPQPVPGVDVEVGEVWRWRFGSQRLPQPVSEAIGVDERAESVAQPRIGSGLGLLKEEVHLDGAVAEADERVRRLPRHLVEAAEPAAEALGDRVTRSPQLLQSARLRDDHEVDVGALVGVAPSQRALQQQRAHPRIALSPRTPASTIASCLRVPITLALEPPPQSLRAGARSSTSIRSAAPRRKRQSSALVNERLGQLQLRIFKDAGSHLRHRVEQAARLQRLAVLRL